MFAKSACHVGAAVVFAMLLSAHTAQAQLGPSARMNIGQVYVGASAGIIIPSDLHVNFSGDLTGSGDYSFSAGPAFTGLVGYHVNDLIAVEGEFGYGGFDYDRFDGSFGGTAVTVPASGSVTTVSLLANVIATPFGRPGGFLPYVGGGIGFANFDSTINALGATGFNVSSSETDFAANFIAGFDYALDSRWSVGGRYRFLWVNTSSSATNVGVTQSVDNFTAHILTANATYRF